MKFLKSAKNKEQLYFCWPLVDDYDEVHEDAIFMGPINLDGHRTFTLSNFNEIQVAFDKIKRK